MFCNSMHVYLNRNESIVLQVTDGPSPMWVKYFRKCKERWVDGQGTWVVTSADVMKELCPSDIKLSGRRKVVYDFGP